MKIAFFGTPEIAAHCLRKLIDNNFNVVACYTRTDKPAGRGKKILKSPVKQLAEKEGIPVIQPKSLKSSKTQQELKALQPDICIVVAFGMIFPQDILTIPKLGCINVHASLLPTWRGASPISTSILHGDAVTGVTIMQMDVGMDTGDMLLQENCNITTDDTTLTLTNKLAKIGGTTLIKVISNIEHFQKNAKQQDDTKASYTDKIEKKDSIIDWNLSATKILRQINAYNPWPVAQSPINGHVVKIYNAITCENKINKKPGEVISCSNKELIISCGDNSSISILEMQFPGKKRLNIKDILNAKKDFFLTNKFEVL